MEKNKLLYELNTEYYQKFSELKDNFSLLPETQYNYMCEILERQYRRDYATLDGENGIKRDIYTAELEAGRKLRTKEIEERNALEQEAIEHKYNRQKQENKIYYDTAIKELEIKRSEIVPNDIPKRWWQFWLWFKKPRPNYAKVLATQKAGIEAESYFRERESDIELLQANSDGVPDIMVQKCLEVLDSVLPAPRRKRARNKRNAMIEALAAEISSTLLNMQQAQTRAQAGEQELTPMTDKTPPDEPQEEQQPTRRRRRRTENQTQPQTETPKQDKQEHDDSPEESGN